MSKSKGNIIFSLTGSIACYKVCNVISKLVQNGYEVKAVCTKSATEFIGLTTLETLTGKSVYVDMWERKTALDHIELNKWADLTIVAPATANIMNKFSAGFADECVSTLFLSHDRKKPFLIAPAMNTNMWDHPATQKSVEVLKGWGVKILDTEKGHLACGDEGYGRLLNPDKIYDIIIENLKK
ncbi:MAG: flavoprotein [Elusimicrobiaceae bacterium]|jgi:phosphopantothenoylcysteine decarboxylase / phosphopantothenate---cysteine ligase|nr:flavoprotein [Elusimicrobiaceae bacterium]MBT3954818.1 flavoprotein [Elusimicrobiaceae bacterium]MBT4008812.1 flavoprotein [Elusimicrobiaceae bacterium]MBT4402434.1 flavoprotein [Elusimicrobiaceae bacterium]MBT4440299.1 flavoprotein [Elusimicrobiaceae bacterium]